MQTISSLGWLHTLGSLPAIPLALTMLGRHGAITPRTLAGRAYLACMLLGAITAFPISTQAAGTVLASLTLLLLALGYSANRWPIPVRAARYVETLSLSLSFFLLMLPAVTETMRRLPAEHPLAADLHAPLLLAAQTGCLLILIVGMTLQIRHLRRSPR